MATYIAFLRAINLGATRKFPKDAIRAATEAAGGQRVETYINTGNVRLDSRLRSRERVEEVLEEAYLADRGFPVPTIAFTPEELGAIAEDAKRFADEHRDGGGGGHYVSLLKQEPSAEAIAALEERSSAGQVARVGGRAVHLLISTDYHRATLTNTQVEQHLGVSTNRNLTVVRTLAERWGG
ncbi:DUF1697 domain-containing protein [Nocardioides panaciterrulae]|uniref:Uncharacterized protein (DUF1697 family) n=1 Tax=Nocardioides panaciterrulae TaxID=661492 RepID=A0A7Y9JB93_9ACTN|nr:DUF1697 domain-containing protein [Nocardioides panaciterrulae]NYD42715.1 uncharacterized protein (DUF1697 family) [Nocardioides panaciterrulae]